MNAPLPHRKNSAGQLAALLDESVAENRANKLIEPIRPLLDDEFPIWQRLCDSLPEGLHSPILVDYMHRYCRLQIDIYAVELELEREGFVVSSAQGSLTAHPCISILDRLLRQQNLILGRLGIVASARMDPREKARERENAEKAEVLQSIFTADDELLPRPFARQ